ncbi:uncharacterized protein THITE_133689 [Thermothielavioides terrestris NRRL 8126]|uniref:Methyltransferase domain-containing protein n=1 Tax=Thermothielavioides terrestris (strain ATCC 38088 / NRRL 8126) TaxID=578455 RepID=G2QQK6_THETT|nr:uncharacterized protein THITE_133689 [Thermothielavioides terrestris NRRL 8126]AEO62416.1 hypothetical protein THITE_133689 [Thermothielavioides terrestris NRRL 8126]
MTPPESLTMSFPSGDRPLDNYQFTFESYLTDSDRIEADVSYHFPNDVSENERVEEQYEILKMVMDGRLHLAPFSRDHPPRKVLDIATGTGNWAIEMGDLYPEAEIIGTDLSPIQPSFVPPNVRFFVEDSSDDWDYPSEFDFIHTRMTISCWSDMKTQIIQRAFDHLRPGGWLECQEAPATIDCDDGTMPDDYAWLRWSLDFQAVSRLANRQSEIGPYLKDWMREVGFVDVQEVTFKLPLNGWPKDPRLKHIGMLWQRNLLEGVSAFSLGMFHRFMGKSVEEIELSLVDVRKCLFDRSVHAYHRLYVVFGRKPETA